MSSGAADEHRTRSGLIILAICLWLTSAVLSLLIIPATIDAVTDIYAAFVADYGEGGRSYWGAVAIRQLLVLPLAVVAVAVVIGGAEYHMRNFDTRKSWLIFTYTLSVQLGVLMISWVI